MKRKRKEDGGRKMEDGNDICCLLENKIERKNIFIYIKRKK